MSVPITSDLAGYTGYWTRTVLYMGLGAVVLLSPVYALLYLIWQRLR